MIYVVSDVTTGMDYAPGEEVIDTVEAATPEEAVMAALMGVSQGFGDMVRMDPAGFREHGLTCYEAVPAV